MRIDGIGPIALLHFTASPAIGGIERLIDYQIADLKALGCAVRLIVGAGGSQED